MGEGGEIFGIGTIEFAISLLLAAFTIGFPIFQIERAKRQRTSELFSEFYSSEHYRCVVLPVYRLMRKIDALQGSERKAYLDAIIAGWDRSPDSVALWKAFEPEEIRARPAMEQHFRVEHSTEAHTEHESLTSFLYFWVRAHRMLNTRLISRSLFQELFCNSFAYYHEFLDLLREGVERSFAAEPDGIRREAPSWIEATREIERILDVEACRN